MNNPRINVLTALISMIVLGSVAYAANPPPPKGMIEESGQMHDSPGSADFMRYAAWYPQNSPPSKPLALIVALHGLRGNEFSQLFYMGSVGLKRNNLVSEAVVLGLKSKGEGWSDDDHEPIEHAIRWAKTRWHIDTDRIYAYGISHGAMRMGIFAPRHQEIFAAAMILSGNIQGLPQPAAGVEPDLSFYVMHGDADPIVSVQNGRDAARDLAAAGYHFLYREYTGEKHIYAGKVLNICLPDGIRWMFAQRLRHAPSTPAQQAVINAAKEQASGTGGKFMALAPLGDLAGTQVDQVIAAALANSSPKVRLAAATLCLNRLYGNPVRTTLATLTRDTNADVRHMAIAALGLAANWRDESAINALVAVVNDAKSRDRALAAGELGAAWRLDRLCTNHSEVIRKLLDKMQAGNDQRLSEIADKGLAGLLIHKDDTIEIDASAKRK